MPYLCSLLDVTIGTQTWAACNLNVSEYSDGTSIPEVQDPTAWAALTTGAWCWYNNDSVTYAATYGKLYNWYAVNDTRGLAPSGWHIPTDAEWTILTNYLGGTSIAGGKMKKNGTSNWKSPNTGATNESGFSALPGGSRESNGAFTNVGNFGCWWSASENNTTNAGFSYLDYSFAGVLILTDNKKRAFSVRCVRD
jgi:uncharacterized protein (TIGR02145 family)